MTALICKDGTYTEIEQSYLIECQRTYQSIDVYREVDAMRMWLESNPSKRKTARGMKRFVNSWLKRADDKGAGLAEARPENKRTRDMTEEEHFSRNWAR